MNKRTRYLAIILGVVFGGIIAFNLIKKAAITYLFAHYVPPAVSVAAAVSKVANWHPYLEVVGTFVAKNGTDVSPQSPGQITKIYFKSGQYISAGQPLVDLDDSVEQADLKMNQSDLDLQRNEYNRQKELYKHSATSSSNLEQAQNRLLQAEARVEKITALIRQKHISAPFSGLLGIRKVNLGQYIKPGEGGIVSLQELDPIFIKFYVPEQLVNDITINQAINFQVEQYPNLTFKGKIKAINSKSDSNTHNIEIQATVSNCPLDKINYLQKSKLSKTVDVNANSIVKCAAKLNRANNVQRFTFMPGMFANIKIIQPMAKNNVVIPSTAISYSMYGDSIFVIIKEMIKSKEILKVKKVFVTTGEEQGNLTVIKKGLSAGQMVVASGEFKLQDGTQVAINNSVPLPNINTTNQPNN